MSRTLRGAALAVVLALTGCGEGDPAGDAGRQQVPYWADGVRFDEVARVLGVTVPAGATARAAARQRGFQGDGLLLAFVVPRAVADRFVAGLEPEEPLVERAVAAHPSGEYRPVTPFARLGLPEPETLDGVTAGPVCAPCAGELDSLEVTVAPLDGHRARIYLRGVD
ncbi:hypothetical protein AB0D49_34690 [Streptomyces sp. NPDC048290]|uniref:hypothetical protein n=1 Tax=Streptomyces sp. NPDC048290 TaxID=3155811 RepID=UPI00342C6691